MWYCFRGSLDFRDGDDSYRIGYAESEDPINWRRDDSKTGLSVGESGWDSTMQAYPAIITENTTLMLSTDSDLFKYLKQMDFQEED